MRGDPTHITCVIFVTLPLVLFALAWFVGEHWRRSAERYKLERDAARRVLAAHHRHLEDCHAVWSGQADIVGNRGVERVRAAELFLNTLRECAAFYGVALTKQCARGIERKDG